MDLPPQDKAYKPLHAYFLNLNRSRFSHAREQVRLLATAVELTDFTRELLRTLNLLSISYQEYLAGEYLPVTITQKKASFFSFGSSSASSPAPNGSAEERDPTAIYLDLMDAIRKCKYYLEEASEQAPLKPFFSSLFQQLQVIVETRRKLVECYLWLFHARLGVPVVDGTFAHHLESLAALVEIRRSKQAAVNPFLTWLWHECDCESTLHHLLLSVFQAQQRQCYLVSCLHLHDALKTIHYWHSAFSRSSLMTSSPLTRRAEASPSGSSMPRAILNPNRRSLSTKSLVLDRFDSYGGSPGKDSPGSLGDGDVNEIFEAPSSSFSSFLSEMTPAYNLSATLLGVDPSVIPPTWDVQYFGAPSVSHVFLRDWARALTFRSCFLFSRIVSQMEARLGSPKALQSQNLFGSVFESLFVKTQASCCSVIYRWDPTSDYHPDGYRAPYTAPGSRAQQGPDVLDGLRAWPCIYTLPGPHHPIEHAANVVSLIMELTDGDLVDYPRRVQLKASSYLLAPVDPSYTIVLIYLTRKRVDDIYVRQFFSTVVPLLRTTDVLKKSLVGRRQGAS